MESNTNNKDIAGLSVRRRRVSTILSLPGPRETAPLLPRLACKVTTKACVYCVLGDSPEQQQHGLGESLKVVVPVDLRGVVQGNLSKHLTEGRRRTSVTHGKKKGSNFPPLFRVSGGAVMILGLIYPSNGLPV